MSTYIGEREIKEFKAEQEGDWIVVEFVDGSKLELSGTLFFKIQSEAPRMGQNPEDLVAHYFATEFFRDMTLNRIPLIWIQRILISCENYVNNMKEIAFGHVYGEKHFLNVRIDNIARECELAMGEAEAEVENRRLAAEQAAKDRLAELVS